MIDLENRVHARQYLKLLERNTPKRRITDPQPPAHIILSNGDVQPDMSFKKAYQRSSSKPVKAWASKYMPKVSQCLFLNND